jgi:hypothetical protein
MLMIALGMFVFLIAVGCLFVNQLIQYTPDWRQHTFDELVINFQQRAPAWKVKLAADLPVVIIGLLGTIAVVASLIL